ncbi:MAG: chromate transporter [Fusobacteriaceae bacterium]
MIFFKLFYVFLKIGFFSFGGGLAMLPMVQEEVYKYGWLSESEFLNVISISQVTPGAISINTATFVGLKMGGILGALSAALGIVVPSLVTILLIALVYEKIKNNPYKEAFFRGVKPVTLALILYAGIIIGKPTFLIGESFKLNYWALGIFIVVVTTSEKIKINPVFILLGSGVLGLVFF